MSGAPAQQTRRAASRKTVTDVTMSEELAAFRNRMPGCSVVTFADLSTGMVLASSTAQKTAQERLDALCEAARDALTGEISKQIAQHFAADATEAPHVAVQADAERITCFVRAAFPAQEALCCIVSARTPVDVLVKEAQSVLERWVVEG